MKLNIPNLLSVMVSAAMLTSGFAADEKAPLQVTVKLDKTEYMHGLPGTTYIMAPTGSLTATMTVKNVSATPQTLSFSSGQKYDFVIRDTQGKEVKLWSQGMMFTQAVDSLTMAPGQEQTYQEAIGLGAPGKPLPLGDYKLEGTLSSSAPRTSAPVPFKIIPTP